MRHRKYDRQQVFNYIVRYKTEHDGNSPSYRQMMEEIGCTSTSVMDYILHELERDELIIIEEASRSIVVAGGAWRWNGGGVGIKDESH